MFDENQKVNGCETGECKVVVDYKVPANYMFHIVRPKHNIDHKLCKCYKNCLEKFVTYNTNFIAFCCLTTGIYGFDQMKATEMALSTVRFWLESNHSSVDHIIFCTHEKGDY